jgi:branched-chain amino acid aminotransferase
MAHVDIWEIIPEEKTEFIKTVNHRKKFECLDVASQFLPGGAYTTFRTFEHSKVLHLDAHLKRLDETANLMGMPININEQVTRSAIKQAVSAFKEEEARIRLTIDLEFKIGTVFISLEKLTLPTVDDYLNGVMAVTKKLSRRNPKAKYTEFISTANEIREQVTEDVNEILMVDDQGLVLEGLSSNVFAVKSGQIWTADDGVLHGLTRQIVLEEAKADGQKVNFQSIRESEIKDIDEVFITSASRAILPVIQINSTPICNRRPGSIAKRLLARYTKRIEHDIEEL